METGKFFEERSDQSEVKARIVTKYFFAWAHVMMRAVERRGGKIAYIDLYAGPGRYKDGAASTPLLVLDTAINDSKMARMLVSYFNDSRNENTATLQEEINKLRGVEKLKYKPITTCGEVDGEAARYFEKTLRIPSFSFIDPFGYKGLSLNIIKGVIKDWGCDCVFFFNYNRINAGIGNQFVAPHMDNLFGKARADALRIRLPGMKPELREALVLEELANEIKRLGGTHVLPFTFKNTRGTRTSHKLIFVSKHFRGYSIMKSIMAGESSTHDEGEKWTRKFGQRCKVDSAQMRGPYDNGETTEFFSGLQGEGRTRRAAGRRDCGRTGVTVPSTPEHDREVEARGAGRRERDVPAR